MLKIIFISSITLWTITACGETVSPTPVNTPKAAKPFEQNATDAVGVAGGDKQVSPFGKPAH